MVRLSLPPSDSGMIPAWWKWWMEAIDELVISE